MAKTLKKLLAVILAASMTMSMVSFTSLAVGEKHLEDCGYQCVHVHGEECKKIVTEPSTDPEEGYQPAVEGKDAVICPNGEACTGGEEDHVEPQDAVEAKPEVMGQKTVMTDDNCTHDCEKDGCSWACAEGCPVKAAEEDKAAKIADFLAAVADVPEITKENWEENQTLVADAWKVYDPVYKLYESDPNNWTKAVWDAYNTLKAANEAVTKFRAEKEAAEAEAVLAAYPFTGEWAEAEDGTDVLTITGEGTYEGSFALVENGERVEISGLSALKKRENPFIVVLNANEIKERAFLGCSQLAGITLKGVTEIGDRAFENCTILRNADLTGVKRIGQYAFCKCALTGELELDGVDFIALGAFSYCNALTGVSLKNIGSFGHSVFYQCRSLTEAVLSDCGEISYRAFRGCPALEKVTITDVETVGWLAFQSCGKLTTVTMSGVDLIEGGAFEDCDSLTTISIGEGTKLGYVDADRNLTEVIPGITERVEDILRGEFTLLNAPEIVELFPDAGWEDSRIGKSDNWDRYDNGTQLVEQARWTDTDKTEAEVKVDAYYTAEKQMDYIFVVDMSNSMTKLGNPADQNARFYDMQSKLLDVSGQLLSTEGYDCRVAFVTFGLTSSETFGFYSAAGEARDAIFGLTPYYENTNYGLGLRGAEALLRNQEAGRKTTVIFISDGQPRDSKDNTTADLNGAGIAAVIKNAGVSIYGVLQSVPADEHEGAVDALKNVCSEGLFFESADTQSFSDAVNDAIAAAYGAYTVTIPVNPDFENVRDLSVGVTGGEANVSADGKTVTWTITGMPFTKYTLTYKMSLSAGNAARYGEQTYPVNSGNAFVAGGASVETPILTRTVEEPYVPSVDPDPTYTLTIRYVYADGTTARPTVTRGNLEQGDRYSVTSPVIEDYEADILVVEGSMPARNLTVTVTYTAVEDVEETDPPTTETPEVIENPETEEPNEPEEVEELDETGTPLAELPEETEDLGETETPLADVPQTGDMLWLWILLAVSSAAGLIWISLEEKKGKRVIK